MNIEALELTVLRQHHSDNAEDCGAAKFRDEPPYSSPRTTGRLPAIERHTRAVEVATKIHMSGIQL
jgi:hypothetical protein